MKNLQIKNIILRSFLEKYSLLEKFISEIKRTNTHADKNQVNKIINNVLEETPFAKVLSFDHTVDGFKYWQDISREYLNFHKAYLKNNKIT